MFKKCDRSHRRSSDDDETRLLNPHEDSSSRVQEDLVDRLIHSASDISAAEPNSGSLKGNLSLKSLYERNYKYGFDEHFQSSKAHLYDSSGDSLQIDVSSSQDRSVLKFIDQYSPFSLKLFFLATVPGPFALSNYLPKFVRHYYRSPYMWHTKFVKGA